MKIAKLIVLASVLGLGIAGCEEKKPTIGATAADAAKSAADAAKNVAGSATDAAKGAMDKIKVEGGKWLTDTVEKQWPEAKKTLETLASKVSSISDAGAKTKAQGLVSDLQAKVPQMEGLVSQLKDFKDGDFGALLGKAKEMWAGFESKLGELKSLVK